MEVSSGFLDKIKNITKDLDLYRVMIGYEGNSSFYYGKDGKIMKIFSTFSPNDDDIAIKKLQLFKNKKNKKLLDTTYYEKYNGINVPVTVNFVPKNSNRRYTFYELLKQYINIRKHTKKLVSGHYKKDKNNNTKKKGGGNTKNHSKTKSNKRSISISSNKLSIFQKEITVIFFEMLLMIKLFHWKTYSYATHKATDELYSKFNEHMDTFIEVLLGKTNSRIDLTNEKKIPLIDLNNQEQLIKKIDGFKSYLVSLNTNPALSSMANTDLFNIRDEILGDMNQFLYLLTFK